MRAFSSCRGGEKKLNRGKDNEVRTFVRKDVTAAPKGRKRRREGGGRGNGKSHCVNLEQPPEKKAKFCQKKETPGGKGKCKTGNHSPTPGTTR